MTIPSTQRAWLITRRGEPSNVLKLFTDTPIPKLGKGEVLVRVKSTALNPVGYKLMKMLPWPIAKFPMGAEQDFAGVVMKDDSGVWKEGQEVVGHVELSTKFKQGRGCLQEYVIVPTKDLVEKPSNITFPEAAGIATVGMTSYQGLVTHGHVKRGDRVFINGGSSSAGAVAIQMAKQLGCYVSTSCSGPKTEMVKGFGADEVFDYTASPLTEQLKRYAEANGPFDLIYDCIGTPSLYSGCAHFLKPKRPFVTISFDFHGKSTLGSIAMVLGFLSDFLRPGFLGGVPRKFKVFGMADVREDFEAVVQMVEEGKVKIPIDSVNPSNREGVMTAYYVQMSGKAKGKIIVDFA